MGAGVWDEARQAVSGHEHAAQLLEFAGARAAGAGRGRIRPPLLLSALSLDLSKERNAATEDYPQPHQFPTRPSSPECTPEALVSGFAQAALQHELGT